MLRSHVDDHRLVVPTLDVDVARVDVVALGQAEHGADLAAQVPRPGVAPGQELLGPLGGLGHQRRLLGPVAAGDEDALARPLVLLVLAHRGPGASLNCTGTRPTP
jgi:hypothetical protein